MGTYALVTACVLMAAWLRTLYFNDQATFTINDRIHMVWTLKGGFIWLAYDAGGDMALDWRIGGIAKPDSYGGSTRAQLAKSWREHFESLGRPPRVWTANYSSLIIPLALLSTWLLLSKPRSSSQPKVTESASEQVV